MDLHDTLKKCCEVACDNYEIFPKHDRYKFFRSMCVGLHFELQKCGRYEVDQSTREPYWSSDIPRRTQSRLYYAFAQLVIIRWHHITGFGCVAPEMSEYYDIVDIDRAVVTIEDAVTFALD